MQNITVNVEGNKLVLTVDLSQEIAIVTRASQLGELKLESGRDLYVAEQRQSRRLTLAHLGQISRELRLDLLLQRDKGNADRAAIRVSNILPAVATAGGSHRLDLPVAERVQDVRRHAFEVVRVVELF
jgi:hypothetical protein